MNKWITGPEAIAELWGLKCRSNHPRRIEVRVYNKERAKRYYAANTEHMRKIAKERRCKNIELFRAKEKIRRDRNLSQKVQRQKTRRIEKFVETSFPNATEQEKQQWQIAKEKQLQVRAILRQQLK